MSRTDQLLEDTSECFGASGTCAEAKLKRPCFFGSRWSIHTSIDRTWPEQHRLDDSGWVSPRMLPNRERTFRFHTCAADEQICLATSNTYILLQRRALQAAHGEGAGRGRGQQSALQCCSGLLFRIPGPAASAGRPSKVQGTCNACVVVRLSARPCPP